MTTPTAVPAKTEFPNFAVRPLRTIAVGAIALAAGVWATTQFDRQTSQMYSGRLQARMVTITAQSAARLKTIHVTPGERVAAGTPLFVLESEEALQQTSQRRQEAEHKQQTAIRVKAAAELELHWRRRELQAEIFQTQLRLAGVKQERLHLDVAKIAWREQLSATTVFRDEPPRSSVFRFISDAAPVATEERVQAMLNEDAAATTAEALDVQIALCEQRLIELRNLDSLLESQIWTSHGVEHAKEESRIAAEAAAAQTDESQSAIAVLSPSYGLAGLFRRQPGDRVEAGEVLVQILDDDRRSIEVEIPSASVNLFKTGQPITLKFPGAEMRTGTIAAIPPQTSANRSEASDSVITLVIEPVGRLWPQVPIGSQVLVVQP